jgi:hypothetical protein
MRARLVGLLIGLFAASAGARYDGGLGTADQPYLISTAAHLQALGQAPQDWDKCFKLTADIDMTRLGPTAFGPIGTTANGPFTGVFDGNHRTIAHLHLANEFGGYLGLFGLVDAVEARILNVTLTDPNVVSEAGRYVGALVGLFANGTLTNCHVQGGRIRGLSIVGGLLGENMDGKIADCTTATTVQGSARVGGLAGANVFGDIFRCRATGTILGEVASWNIGGLLGENQDGRVTACRAGADVQGGDRVGGLIGENIGGWAECCWAEGAVSGITNVGGLVGCNTAGTTRDCYAAAVVTAVMCAGGLVGYNGPNCNCVVTHPSLVARCYAAGPVNGASAGGLIALNYRSKVEASFWDIQATGCAASDGGEGETIAQMQSPALYLAFGWDFVAESANGTKDIWYMPGPGGYPRLAWELPPVAPQPASGVHSRSDVRVR